MFCFLSMFLNNVEKNGKNIYSYIYLYTFKKIVFKVNIHNLPQFFNHTVALVQNKNNERISLEWGVCQIAIIILGTEAK